MTAEERILIDLSDVLGLEFTCKICGVRVAIAPGSERNFLPEKCPSCGVDLFDDPSPLKTAIQNLKGLLSTHAILFAGARFRLQLVVAPEVKNPSKPKP